MDYKKIIPCMCIMDGNISNAKGWQQPVEAAVHMDECQADALFIGDISKASDDREDRLIAVIKRITAACDIPLYVAQPYSRFEDVKKIIYAGASKAVISCSSESFAVLKEAADRFGGDQVCACISEEVKDAENVFEMLSSLKVTDIFIAGSLLDSYAEFIRRFAMSAFVIKDYESIEEMAHILSYPYAVGAVDTKLIITGKEDIMDIKSGLSDSGIFINRFISAVPFSDFKLDANGLIPAIVQDYKSGEVLMLAYMNEASYRETLRSGRMTYYSRSRQALWKKGETSGHFQYVKSLDIDCDKDTILAKVSQVGAACHTGNRSCFYTNLVKKEYDGANPLTILEEIMDTVLDRKAHPKEGSYTNYLFDKGIDKILKKVGEEATEIVIAAKNPDAEELKYEISDFLYHMMVLMAERDVSWKEIMKELAARH